MRNIHPAVWLIPAIMLVIAVMPLSYGYFRLLRLVVCGCSGFLAYHAWLEKRFFDVWVALLSVVALLFNPLIPIHLDKSAWRIIDLTVAAFFVLHWRLSHRTTA